MRQTIYTKPNINNFKGKKGREILKQIRNLPIASRENLRREADECMGRILASRKDV